MNNKYVDSKAVMASVINYESKSKSGLNGFILLVHIGTDPRRTDKFYLHLPELISTLKNKGYSFVTINELLSAD
jgi:endoglucanase